MGANVSIVIPDYPPDECPDCNASYEWFCHCDEDPQPVKKAPRVLGEDERFSPPERRARRCALCEFVADEPGHHHCERCFVFWEEDPASYPTEAEIREKERQDFEGGHEEGCYLGKHCELCCGCSRQV